MEVFVDYTRGGPGDYSEKATIVVNDLGSRPMGSEITVRGTITSSDGTTISA